MRTKLKYEFENMELDDRIIAVPVGQDAKKFRGVVKLNESAVEIFELLKQETTEDEIVSVLEARYGNDTNIQGFVHDMIMYLAEEGVLE